MTEVMVNKALMDELHEQGWHLVTRSEWYEMQAQLAATMTDECRDYKAALEEIRLASDDANVWCIASDALDKHAKRQSVKLG